MYEQLFELYKQIALEAISKEIASEFEEGSSNFTFPPCTISQAEKVMVLFTEALYNMGDSKPR